VASLKRYVHFAVVKAVHGERPNVFSGKGLLRLLFNQNVNLLGSFGEPDLCWKL
jgi:hypothetical protein